MQNRMITLPGSELQYGCYIFWFEIRIILEDFFPGGSGCQQIKNIFYSDPYTPDARSATALFGVDGYSR